MSTISTGLSVIDQMTPVLKSVFNSLNLTLSAMEDMGDSMDKSFNPSAITAARQSIRDTEAAIKDLPQPLDEAGKKQKNFNDQLNKGENAAGGLVKKIIGFVAAYAGFRSIKGFMGDSRNLAFDQIRSEQRLQTIMMNINGMTQDGIDLVKQYSKELETTGKTSISSGVSIFGQSQLAEYVYDPKNIISLTKAMHELASETYGVEVSQDQLMQTANLLGKVMMGDINALSRNGFKIDAIFDEAEQKILRFGTEAERTALVVRMIEENLNGLSEAMANTDEGKLERLGHMWDAIKEKIGYGVIRAFGQFSDLIMTHMPTIEAMLITVFYTLFNLLDSLATIAGNVLGFFISNWTLIEPIIWGIVWVLGAYVAIQGAVAGYTALSTAALYLQTVATIGLKTAWQALNATMKANVFILLISLIVGLIVWLVKLWQSNDNFAAGLMRAWNSILNFFDKIPIFFKWVGNGIVNTFQSMKVKTLEIIDALINGVIDGLNWLMEKSNKYLGTSFEMIGHVEYAATAAIEAEAIKQAGEDALKLMEDNAAKKAAEREQKVLNMLNSRAAKRAQEEAEKNAQFAQPELIGMGAKGDWNIDEIGSVGEVGKIKDTVDISSEDLKTMRELAEMKSIQNFVSLTPTVSVVHTGDINNGYDVDTIVTRIKDTLEGEIASSTEGVYA